MSPRVRGLFAIVAVLGSSGCFFGSDDPLNDALAVGTITVIIPSADGSHQVLIENSSSDATPTEPRVSGGIIFTVYGNTPVFVLHKDGSLQKSDFSVVTVGARAAAWAHGAILESKPAQAPGTTKITVILDS